jgi:hypothetical protein
MDPDYESRRQNRRDAFEDDGPTRNVQCASH